MFRQFRQVIFLLVACVGVSIILYPEEKKEVTANKYSANCAFYYEGVEIKQTCTVEFQDGPPNSEIAKQINLLLEKGQAIQVRKYYNDHFAIAIQNIDGEIEAYPYMNKNVYCFAAKNNSTQLCYKE